MKVFSSNLAIRNFYNAHNREEGEYVAFPMLFRGEEKMLESKFQKDLIADLENLFPGALIYKNESKQGLPDLTVLWNNHWALLECKKSKTASHQPNQDYYVEMADKMSFSRFVYPENKQEVLDAIQQAFGVER